MRKIIMIQLNNLSSLNHFLDEANSAKLNQLKYSNNFFFLIRSITNLRILIHDYYIIPLMQLSQNGFSKMTIRKKIIQY